jgi:hypothetical protein
MTTNQVLSKKLQVPSLRDNETATFQLLNAAKKEGGREEPTTPEIFMLSEQQNVSDPYDENKNTRKTIQNVVGMVQALDGKGRPQRDLQGVPVMLSKLERVSFRKGFITLTAAEDATYQYMMRRKDNLSNPFRGVMGGKTVAPRFKLVDDKRELAAIMQKKELQFIAQRLIRESKFDALKAIAVKMNTSPDSKLHIPEEVINKPQELKLALLQKAELYEKYVINSSSDQPSRVRVQIAECRALGILILTGGEWKFLGKDKSFFTSEPDADPTDSLVEFFMDSKDKKGSEAYKEMTESLKEALKA